ncbi:MAG: hypothetical protein ACC631_10140, partial [Halocynthiibacter sp.]
MAIPPDVSFTADGSRNLDIGAATATDIFGPVVLGNDSPGNFPIGNTPVQWTATDTNGNVATAFQTISIVPPTAGGWGTPVLVETSDAQINSVVSVRLAAAPNGKAVAVWTQKEETKYRLFANYFIAGLGWQGAEIIDNQSSYRGVPAFDVSMDAVGNVLVMWDTNANYTNRFEITTGWTGPELFDSGVLHGAPVLGMAPDGSAAVMWARQGETPVNARILNPGPAWSPPAVISIGYKKRIQDSVMVRNYSGEAIALWQLRPNASSVNYYDLYANLYVP